MYQAFELAIQDSARRADPVELSRPIGAPTDDLSREVYCLLGVPIDIVDMGGAVERIQAAANRHAPFLFSTPNLNFLIQAQRDPAFRDSLWASDLNTVDGVPLIWLSRMLGIPQRVRVAGSDILEALNASSRPISTFLFGGAQGVAQLAAHCINERRGSLRCVGALSPGFSDVEGLSSDSIMGSVNKSGAQVLVVALGATKGQAWLLRNHHRITVPVRAHLGAALNFQAGHVRRAPPVWRALGLEWLWRIKEEPALWSRYLKDGSALCRLLFSHVIPLTLLIRPLNGQEQPLRIERSTARGIVKLTLMGAATADGVSACLPDLRIAVASATDRVRLDVARLATMDLRFFGLLLMLLKELRAKGVALEVVGASVGLRRLFRLNRLNHLLINEGKATG